MRRSQNQLLWWGRARLDPQTVQVWGFQPPCGFDIKKTPEAPGSEHLWAPKNLQDGRSCSRVSGAIPGWQEVLQGGRSCPRVAGAVPG